ncbi:MAG TPA: enolase C-terminal domain-like protein [Chloroflexota bacterium]|nr:enolase C-terminal domain-like protein [Chloroflexota bacterium]
MVRIASLEIMKVPPSWVWLKLHTDEAVYGLGEPYLEGHPEAVIAEVRRLEAVLVGEDPRRVEYLWDRMYRVSGYRGGAVTMSAISGIDIALWDVAGKLAGQPIHQMLGGTVRGRIKMYHATGGAQPHSVEPGLPYRAGGGAGAAGGRGAGERRRGGAPADYAEGARVLVEEWGFRALKAHMGAGEDLRGTLRVPEIVERFAAVKEGAGPGVEVAIDVHNPNPTVGAQLLRELAPLRPLFIEEPMPIERVEALEQLVRQSGTTAPVAAGERWMGKWVFFDALSKGLLAVVQPDICHAGGITECRKIAAIAEAAYAEVALHCPLSPIAIAASIQLDAAIPNFLVQEHNEVNCRRVDGKTVIGGGYLKEPFALDEDGCVAVPPGPGLGIELDEAGLEAVMRHEWSERRG